MNTIQQNSLACQSGNSLQAQLAATKAVLAEAQSHILGLRPHYEATKPRQVLDRLVDAVTCSIDCIDRLPGGRRHGGRQ